MDKTTVPPVIKDPRNKPEFPDDFTRINNLSPLVAKHIEFDWEVLRRRLGEAKEEMSETDYALLASVMGELLRWIVVGSRLDVIGRRAAALAWVVNPEMFDGASMRCLSRKLGVRRGVFGNATGAASKRFKIRNRAQAHAGNFKPCPSKKE